MKEVNCPFLGLLNDPNTAMGFPSDGNFCHRTKPRQSLGRAHQREYCLTENYSSCPIYTQAQNLSVLKTIGIALSQGRILRKFIYFFLIIIVFLAIGSIILNWSQIPPVLFKFWSQQVLQATITPTQEVVLAIDPEPSDDSGVKFSSVFVFLPLLNQNAEHTLDQKTSGQTQSNCLQPAGWLPYTVKPTDSIFRISLIFGISVNELLEINCMDEGAILRQGQEIFVPNLPTDTPVPTPQNEPRPTKRSSTTNLPGPKPTKEEKPTSTSPPPVPTSTTEPTKEPPPEPTSPPPPTREPTAVPTPTSAPIPSPIPTQAPTQPPTQPPTNAPTSAPTDIPTSAP